MERESGINFQLLVKTRSLFSDNGNVVNEPSFTQIEIIREEMELKPDAPTQAVDSKTVGPLFPAVCRAPFRGQILQNTPVIWYQTLSERLSPILLIK
jgi:hypothetical protein